MWKGYSSIGNYIQENPALVVTSFGRLRDSPNPQFVEPVETNPEVTAAFAPHARPFDHEGPLVCNSPSIWFDLPAPRPFDKLRALQADQPHAGTKLKDWRFGNQARGSRQLSSLGIRGDFKSRHFPSVLKPGCFSSIYEPKRDYPGKRE